MGRGGVSLLELLAVLFVFGLVASIAYEPLSSSYRLRGALAELRAFLRSSQTEAIRLGRGVALDARSGKVVSCLDADADGFCGPRERTLRVFAPEAFRGTLVWLGAEGKSERFNALGRPRTPFGVGVEVGGKRAVLCVSMGGEIREVKESACE